MCRSWEFQNCKNRPNRSTESEDSFTDNDFTSTAIAAAIAAKIAGEKKKILKYSMWGKASVRKAIFAPRAPILTIFTVLEFSEPRDHSRA